MGSLRLRLGSLMPVYEFGVSDMVVLGVLCVANILYFAHQERARREHIRKNAFPFMKLPAELRAEVFTYLIEPPDRPPPEYFRRRTFRKEGVIGLFKLSGNIIMYFSDHSAHIINALNRNPTKRMAEILGYDWDEVAAAMERYKQRQKLQRHPICKHLNAMRLVSRKFGAEFLTTYLIHATPIFTLEASSTSENPFGVWQHSLHLVKSCTLRMIARPGIANAFDPRQANARDWLLRDSIFASMRKMTTLQSMTLTIEACGNSLWNPLWLWFFTSQAFKESDVSAFRRIEFTMRDWQMRPTNYLQRVGEDMWEWRCVEGHFAAEDEKDIPIRRFCGRLYAQCMECEDRDEEQMDGSSDEGEDGVEG